MKKLIAILAASTLACGLVACTGDDTTTPVNDSGTNNDTGSNTDSGKTDGGDAGNTPAPPKLGAQIDRMGRPAISTALVHTFDTDAGGAGASKNDYNANNDSTTWPVKYSAEFQKNLAVFDSLDTVCGNQIAATPDAGAGRYATLGTVLASDFVWLNAGSTTCNTFLAVEVGFLTKVPPTDCGGRTLKYDVIDAEYGALSGAPGVATDGISADPAKTNGTTFPYLAAAK